MVIQLYNVIWKLYFVIRLTLATPWYFVWRFLWIEAGDIVWESQKSDNNEAFKLKSNLISEEDAIYRIENFTEVQSQTF